MESGLQMLKHSIIITVLVYLALVHIAKQQRGIAGNRALLIGATTLVYMILFGHRLPTGMPKF